MEKLNAWDLADNTILIFMSDNGKALRDRNQTHVVTYNTNNQEGSVRWLGTVQSSNPDSSAHKNFAVRNERYRFVNNKELYDVIDDPGQKNDVAARHPEVVLEMKRVYDKWWTSVRPYMVNENVSLAKEKPFWVEYEKQKKLGEIKAWIKPELN